ncbi:hypothetical protein SCHPADRAFT_1000154 [Schizopora paradoxa]|uniref:DUF6533 domain-containing protein n=1 Tax=Schizopora paradoxa TaxID=27342 RepID=A0A0H2RDI0_9AGAM|nr:hypothetical protein SCHPADRAFT_1000154 [Schizopora paradoxa]
MAQSPQPSPDVQALIIASGNGILQTKYTYAAAFAVMIYDHLITLDVEIEHIWRQKVTLLTVLFFMTRYYFLVSSSVLLFVFIDPLVSTSVCERLLWIIFIFIGAPLIALPNCIIILRIYAIYGRNKTLAIVLLIYIIAQAVGSLLIDMWFPITHLGNFEALGYSELDDVSTMRICVPIVSDKLPIAAKSLSQIMQAIFDTAALAMILVKARLRNGGGLIELVAKQGLAYYTLNAATYITWAFLLMFASPSYKNIISSIAAGLACISVNRLTLHLRSYSMSDSHDTDSDDGEIKFVQPSASTRRTSSRRRSWLGASTLEIPDEINVVSEGRFSSAATTLELRDFSNSGASTPQKLRGSDFEAYLSDCS